MNDCSDKITSKKVTRTFRASSLYRIYCVHEASVVAEGADVGLAVVLQVVCRTNVGCAVSANSATSREQPSDSRQPAQSLSCDPWT